MSKTNQVAANDDFNARSFEQGAVFLDDTSKILQDFPAAYKTIVEEAADKQNLKGLKRTFYIWSANAHRERIQMLFERTALDTASLALTSPDELAPELATAVGWLRHLAKPALNR